MGHDRPRKELIDLDNYTNKGTEAFSNSRLATLLPHPYPALWYEVTGILWFAVFHPTFRQIL